MSLTLSTAYLEEVLASLSQLSTSDPGKLFRTSDALLESFKAALQRPASPNMLPSYTTALPTGTEQGSAVAMDLGGSTLRVALIRLRPHRRLAGPDAPHLPAVMEVAARRSWLVKDDVKKLAARPFFDWIATCIAEVLSEAGVSSSAANLPLGVTWSFPVEPTSAASGLVREMGKGYEQWREIKGTDLKGHMEAAFRRRGLAGLHMAALMNDTEATLLSHAYANPATRMSLIWGTGLNAAVFLPVAAVGSAKLAGRSPRWAGGAAAVVVNTEVSMFGGAGIVPLAAADAALDAASPMPGFQPLEQMTSGRYLGEVVRRILVEAVARDGLFGGHLPAGLDTPWSLDTAIASAFESDIAQAVEMMRAAFGFGPAAQPTHEDADYVRRVCVAVAARSALLIALTLFTLFRLQRDNHPPGLSSPALDARLDAARAPVAIAYCGAVAEKHATARQKCQDALDFLVDLDAKRLSGEPKRRLVLEGAADSGLLGAAVGAVMNEDHKEIRAKL